MSLSADLLLAFEERWATVPVLHVRTGAVARGFLNEAGASAAAQGFDFQSTNTALFLTRGALAVQQDDEIWIGEVGDAEVGPTRRAFTANRSPDPVEDGAIVAVTLLESEESAGFFSAEVETEQGQLHAAIASLLFSAVLAGVETQRQAALASLRFSALAAPTQQQREAATGDNGVPLKYAPGDPLTATRGSTARYVDAGLVLSYAPGGVTALTEDRGSEATYTNQVWP